MWHSIFWFTNPPPGLTLRPSPWWCLRVGTSPWWCVLGGGMQTKKLNVTLNWNWKKWSTNDLIVAGMSLWSHSQPFPKLCQHRGWITGILVSQPVPWARRIRHRTHVLHFVKFIYIWWGLLSGIEPGDTHRGSRSVTTSPHTLTTKALT